MGLRQQRLGRQSQIMTCGLLQIIYYIYTSFLSQETQGLLMASVKAQLFPGQQTIRTQNYIAGTTQGVTPAKAMSFPPKHEVMVQACSDAREDLAGGDYFTASLV